MDINEAGLDLIKGFEGCCLKSYQDQGGVWTIGYGSTRDVEACMEITLDQALERLKEDLAETVLRVNNLLSPVQVNENQFSALVSFTYNVGSGNFAQSTLRQFILKHNCEEAGVEFLKWCKVAGTPNSGLLRRRQAEKVLFETPVSQV